MSNKLGSFTVAPLTVVRLPASMGKLGRLKKLLLAKNKLKRLPKVSLLHPAPAPPILPHPPTTPTCIDYQWMLLSNSVGCVWECCRVLPCRGET